MTLHPLHMLGFEPIAHAPAEQALASEPVVGNQGVTEKIVKGTRVRLADGARARVVYVDPNLRIVRVRTEDGRNITVRRKQVTLLKP
jgi:hypothetical protein